MNRIIHRYAIHLLPRAFYSAIMGENGISYLCYQPLRPRPVNVVRKSIDTAGNLWEYSDKSTGWNSPSSQNRILRTIISPQEVKIYAANNA